MFTGKHAFPGMTLESILYNVVHEPPEAPTVHAPGLPAAAVAALDRALQKDPAARFPSVAAFIEALRAALPGAPRPRGLRVHGALLGAAIVLAGVTSAALLSSLMGDHSATPDLATPAAAPEDTPVVTPAGANVASPNDPEPSPGASTSGADAARPTAGRPGTTASPPAAAATPELADVRTKLDRAESELAAAAYRDAVTLAQQSLAIQDTPRAHRILCTAHCRLGDLGNAKAAFHRVSPKDRRGVIDACAAAGIKL
jgi:serine/threonine-protein kinase